jgi:acetyl esterase/lipase
MKFIKQTIAAIALVHCPALVAQNGPPKAEAVDAPDEPDALPLYGEATSPARTGEIWTKTGGDVLIVRNVTQPTLTPFLPSPDKATGAAVIVAPGGAFMLLAIDHEGWRVAQALADRGIAAFVLKYRVMPTPVSEAEAGPFMADKVKKGLPDPKKQPTIQYPPSTDDALAALAMIRANPTKWNVDPKRVGMIGFSAGAMTSLNTVIAAKPDKGPDFFGYIYGPQATVRVPKNAPPMFSAIAFDDPLFPTMGFPIAAAWHKAKRPVEVHAYERGSHGFGLGVEGTTTTLMLDQFVAWMDMRGLLKPKPSEVTSPQP